MNLIKRKFRRQVSTAKSIFATSFIVLILIVIAFTTMLIIMPENAVAADTTWYNSSWKDRIPINLFTSTTSTVTNYQVFLNISFQTGMQSDFDDLRFVNYLDHTNVWGAWLEYKSDSSYALIWIEIGESITTSNQTMMYMYYNNSGASSSWNGENTFNWFEPYTTNVIASPGYNWDNGTNEVGAIYKENLGFNAADNYRLRTKLEITTWGYASTNAPLFAFGLSTSSVSEGYANPPTCGYYMVLYTKTDMGADETHLAYKPTIYNSSSQGSPTYANPAFTLSTDYIFDFNITKTSMGVRMLYPNSGNAVADGTTILSGVPQQNDAFQWIFFHMATQLNVFQWDSASSLNIDLEKPDRKIIMNIDWSFITHWQADEPSSYFGTSEQEGDGSSIYAIKGLEGSLKNITWSGTNGTTVWSNATAGLGGTLEYYMVINESQNVTELRVLCSDINVAQGIIVENITLCVSSDNISFGSLGTFSDRGDGKGNLSVNNTVWNVGTMGANPFLGSGLTNKISSLYFRFLLAIPTGASPSDYSATDCKIYPGYYI